jgi:hypothetical protein
MVVEDIRQCVPADRHTEFEDAWSHARTILDEAPECLG